MDFSYSEELLEIKRIVREFAEKEIRPHVMEWDEKQIFPRDSSEAAWRTRIHGSPDSRRNTAAPASATWNTSTIIEELSRVDGSIGISVAAHNSLCTGHIFHSGTEEQRRRFVVPLAKGEKLGAWSLTEPEAGSDAGGTQTTARLDGDHWILNGQKTFTTHGTYGDICVAMAVTDKSAGHHGISAFILEKGHAGFFRRQEGKQAGAASQRHVHGDFRRLPHSERKPSGRAGHGFIDALKVLDGGRISIAALGVGMAQGAYEAALALFQTAKAVRKADLRISGNSVQACRHGHGNRCRAPADASRRVDEGPGNEDDRANRRWRSSTPAKSRSASPMNAFRSTAATATSRTILPKSSIAT